MFLVLGASGFVGKHLSGRLSANGVDHVATHNRTPFPGSVHFDSTSMSLKDLKMDLSAVTHALILLGETKIEPCVEFPEKTYALNVVSIKKVIGQLFEFGIKPIFTSTEYVFDGNRGNYTEMDKPFPCTAYGRQKVEVENFLVGSGEDYLILRSPKVLGSTLNDGTLLTSWVSDILGQKQIKLARDQRFSATHVDDMTKGMMLALEQDLSGLYHLCTPYSYSRVEMVKTLGKAMGLRPMIEECAINDFKFREKRPLDVSMNPIKFIEKTGMKFRSMESICQDIADQIPSNKGVAANVF